MRSMGWYGIFLVPKMKLLFSLRSVDGGILHDYFDSLDRFFDKYEKMRDDIAYIGEVSEESKTFSAKVTARMFNVIDELGVLPDVSPPVFLLYFLRKHGFEVEYHVEGSINLNDLKKKGWQEVGN